MTIAEFARRHGVSRTIVVRWIAEGRVKAERVRAPTATGYYWNVTGPRPKPRRRGPKIGRPPFSGGAF